MFSHNSPARDPLSHRARPSRVALKARPGGPKRIVARRGRIKRRPESDLRHPLETRPYGINRPSFFRFPKNTPCLFSITRALLLSSAVSPARGARTVRKSLFCTPKMAKPLFSIHCALFGQKHPGWGVAEPPPDPADAMLTPL